MFSSAARSDAIPVHGCQRRNAWPCPDGRPGMHGRHDGGVIIALASWCPETYLPYRLNNHHGDTTDVRPSRSHSPRMERAEHPPATRDSLKRAIARHRAQPRSGCPLGPFAPRSDSQAQTVASQRPHPVGMTGWSTGLLCRSLQSLQQDRSRRGRERPGRDCAGMLSG